jgi:two-component system invasion response regulator UvrY
MKHRPGSPEFKVYLIDEHALHRAGVKQLLAAKGSFVVVGEAGTFAEAAAELAERSAEIVLLELGGNVAAGLRFLPKLLEQSLAVLVLTLHDDPRLAKQALRAGAAGFLSKTASSEQIFAALQAIAAQKPLAAPTAAAPLVKPLRAKTSSGTPALSQRELQILNLIGQGQTTQKIARQLGLSISTIETYRDRIKSKLNLASGAELLRYAILRGLDGKG